MTTLEVLMKAEQSLLDESIPFNFDSFEDCTCGHILRAVEGKRGYAGSYLSDGHPEYLRVMEEIAAALGSDETGVEAIFVVSSHTAVGLKTTNLRDITRKDALNTVRTAMMALQQEPIIEEGFVDALEVYATEDQS